MSLDQKEPENSGNDLQPVAEAGIDREAVPRFFPYINACVHRFSGKILRDIILLLAKRTDQNSPGVSYRSICRALQGQYILRKNDEREVMKGVAAALKIVGIILSQSEDYYQLAWNDSPIGRETRAIIASIDDPVFSRVGAKKDLDEWNFIFAQKLRNASIFEVTDSDESSQYCGIVGSLVKVLPRHDSDYSRVADFFIFGVNEVLVLTRGGLAKVDSRLLKEVED